VTFVYRIVNDDTLSRIISFSLNKRVLIRFRTDAVLQSH